MTRSGVRDHSSPPSTVTRFATSCRSIPTSDRQATGRARRSGPGSARPPAERRPVPCRYLPRERDAVADDELDRAAPDHAPEASPGSGSGRVSSGSPARRFTSPTPPACGPTRRPASRRSLRVEASWSTRVLVRRARADAGIRHRPAGPGRGQPPTMPRPAAAVPAARFGDADVAARRRAAHILEPDTSPAVTPSRSSPGDGGRLGPRSSAETRPSSGPQPQRLGTDPACRHDDERPDRDRARRWARGSSSGKGVGPGSGAEVGAELELQARQRRPRRPAGGAASWREVSRLGPCSAAARGQADATGSGAGSAGRASSRREPPELLRPVRSERAAACPLVAAQPEDRQHVRARAAMVLVVVAQRHVRDSTGHP